MKKKWGHCPAKGKLSTIGGDKTHELLYKSLLRLNPLFTYTLLPIIVMYNLKIQFELTGTLVPSNQPTSQPFPNPMQMQNPFNSLLSFTTVWMEDYFGGFPFYAGPVYQGMAPNRQVQYTGPVYHSMVPNHHLQNQYRPPTSGPSRKRRREEARKAVHPYQNRNTHELSGTVPNNRSTGVDPGMARNDTNNNTRRGMVWKTPSKNPFVTDCNLT